MLTAVSALKWLIFQSFSMIQPSVFITNTNTNMSLQLFVKIVWLCQSLATKYFWFWLNELWNLFQGSGAQVSQKGNSLMRKQWSFDNMQQTQKWNVNIISTTAVECISRRTFMVGRRFNLSLIKTRPWGGLIGRPGHLPVPAPVQNRQTHTTIIYDEKIKPYVGWCQYTLCWRPSGRNSLDFDTRPPWCSPNNYPHWDR